MKSLRMTLEQANADLFAFWWTKSAERHRPFASTAPQASTTAISARNGAEGVKALAATGKQPRVNAGLEKVKEEIRELHKAGFSQKKICDRLGKKPRPAHAAWKELSWPEAFKHPEFHPSVKSWISRV